MNPEKQVELYQSLIHTGPRFGYRHVFSLLGFLGFLNVYAMRVNLSVAIVAMVNSTSNSGTANNTNITDGTCPAPITPGNSTSDQTGEFPITSSRGHKCIFILYHFDTNTIMG